MNNTETKEESLNELQSNTPIAVEHFQSKVTYSMDKSIVEPIDGSPLQLVGNTEQGFIIAMGQIKVSNETYKTYEEAKESITKEMWNIVLNMILAVNIVDKKTEE